jgi:hypothetical protein
VLRDCLRLFHRDGLHQEDQRVVLLLALHHGVWRNGVSGAIRNLGGRSGRVGLFRGMISAAKERAEEQDEGGVPHRRVFRAGQSGCKRVEND